MSANPIDFDPAPAAMRPLDVYASIEGVLARTAVAAAPWGGAPPALQPATAVAPRATRQRARVLAWLGAASAAPLLAVVVASALTSPAPAPRERVLPVAQASLPAPQPALDIVTAGEVGSGAERVAQDLRGGGVDVREWRATGWADALHQVQRAPQGSARIALVHYDALQAARADPASPPLRVVMPLHRSELHVLVRADSPRRWLHELAGARLNVGPPQGPRALTAGLLYERLFESALPRAQADARDLDAALPALLEGGLDAIVLVAPQPSDWLAALPPQVAARLRLLELDPRGAPGKRALRSYLPASVQPVLPGQPQPVPTLSVLAFAVTAGDGPQASEAQTRLAQALCRRLPGLQRHGHAQWRQWQPRPQPVEAGWPYAAGPLPSCPESRSPTQGETS